ncbi:hypothetical protein PAE61_13665 [Paracoccus aerodenitrificans]|nr:hypothetical protein PAE61_13665 [Paracoccus aerodenitrificans]
MNFHFVRHEDLVFVVNHRLLADVAEDLCRLLPVNHGFRASVLVGMHIFGSLPDVVGPKLGIQTEQILDEKGSSLWRDYPIRRVRRDINWLNGMLDFSFANLPAYAELRPSRRRKVLFGPYAFPDHIVPFRLNGDYIAFVGNTHGRRSEILQALSEKTRIDIAPRRTFGERLSRWLEGSSGVLNIHFAEGVYAEIPRMIKAYLAGKVIYSEELSYPFVAGRHYFLLDAFEEDVETRLQVFERFQREIAIPYRFTRFLETFLERQPSEDPGSGRPEIAAPNVD